MLYHNMSDQTNAVSVDFATLYHLVYIFHLHLSILLAMFNLFIQNLHFNLVIPPFFIQLLQSVHSGTAITVSWHS